MTNFIWHLRETLRDHITLHHKKNKRFEYTANFRVGHEI